MTTTLNMRDTINLIGYSASHQNVSTSPAEVAVTSGGIYDVWAITAPIFIKQTDGSSATGVSLTNGYRIPADGYLTMELRAGDKLGYVATEAATLVLHQVA